MTVSSESPAKSEPISPAPLAGSLQPRTRVWREPEFWLVLLLALGIYWTRPATLTIRGEESRWANVAREMIERGDWIVPREQGVVFPNRPPLANWAIALSMLAFGDGETFAVRFPALLATLLTSLVIYTCGRSFLNRFGALVAAAGYASMGQVMQIGRHAETEPLFTLFTAGALLGWLACYVQDRRPWVTWTTGYSLAALAALTKGPQGPIYFVASTWLYLLIYDRGFLVRRGHVIGMAAFVAILAAWQVPYYLATDLSATMKIWGGESANRFVATSSAEALKHLVRFPLEVFNCTLPWSGLLLCFIDRGLRAKLGAAKKPVIFLTLAIVVCIFPLLLAQEARGRYFMPLYPCIALLCGAAAQAALVLNRQAAAQKIWRGAMRLTMVIPIIVATYVVWQSTPSANWLPALRNPTAAQTWPIIALTLVAAAGLIWFCRRAIADSDATQPYRAATQAIVAAAVFYGVAFTGVAVNSLESYSYDTRSDLTRTVGKLPADAKLVSFSLVHHLFAYHLATSSERHVELVPTPTPDAAPRTDWDYFCFNVTEFDPVLLPLPFAWEQVDVVTVDRNRYDRPRSFVVVGRKLPATEKPIPLEAAAPAEQRTNKRS